ncbi:MAG: caspase family protein, partial [Gemmatimonadetes bacterium]
MTSMERNRTRKTLARAAVLLAAPVALLLGAVVAPLCAQGEVDIQFEAELPRVLVFIQEDGNGQVAARAMTNFLLEAGFPIVDPALAFTAAQRELVQAALAGDEGAATSLGRDFGAQVLVLGRADWSARPDAMGSGGMVGTAEVSVRALRLDKGELMAVAEAEAGPELRATEQQAKRAVIAKAAQELLQSTAFVGQVLNRWEAEPWQNALYWVPDPGSVPARLGEAQARNAPGLAILRADVQPAGDAATRGLGVVKRGERSASLFNPVRLEGVVIGEARSVQVDGKPAFVEPLDAAEAARLGLTGKQAQRFWTEMNLPMSQDTVRVVAEGPGGSVTEAVAAPRVDERWAVVIGIGEYASPDIPDLEFARADAEAIYEFLRSDAAGPFEEDHILFLADAEATGAKLREAMFVFLQQADCDDLLFIYFAGHGGPDPNRPDNLY